MKKPAAASLWRGEAKNSGFVALLSAIIIAALLVGLSLVVSTAEFAARGAVLDHELHTTAVYLADSCANSALYSISQNYTYAVSVAGHIIPIGTETCSVLSILYDTENISTHSKTATVLVRATYRNISVQEQIIANVHNPAFPKAFPSDQDITITYWTEIP